MQKEKIKQNEKSVGVVPLGDPNFKGRTKKEKGITLIALIVTIIVMLILVGVTVSVSLNGGLFSTAQKAVDGTQIESEREQLFSAVIGAIGSNARVDYAKLDSNLPQGFTGSNGTYVSSKTGNVYEVYANGTTVNKANNVPEDLLDYLLGVKDETTGTRPGRNFSDIADMNSRSFKNVPEEVGQLTLLTYSAVENVIENDTSMLITDFYFVNETTEGTQAKYKFRAKLNATTLAGTTMADRGVKEIAYDENTRVGKYVQYDNKNWIILYDDSVNGLQMISEDALLDANDQKFYLGYYDGIFSEENFNENVITEIDGTTGKSNLENAMYSYDNMITRLNDICDGLVADAGYIKSVRSVGSNPQNPNYDYPSSFIGSAETIEGYGTSTWFEDNLNLRKNVTANRTYYTIGDTETEYKIKGTDMNFESDFDRMVALGINATESDYWLASRMVDSSDGFVRFNARYVGGGMGFSNGLWGVYFEGASGGSNGYAVRPVVSLGSTIQFVGEGTEVSPYTIQK